MVLKRVWFWNSSQFKISKNQNKVSGKINAIFCGDRMPKEGSYCISLLAIMVNSFFRIGKNYYLKFFVEECKMHCQIKSDKDTLDKIKIDA